MIVKSKMTLNYYGSTSDLEFFDLIYQSFEQKVKNLVIQKCGVVLNRSQDIQLDSILGYYLIESERRLRLEFELFDETDVGIGDFCSFSLLIRMNFLRLMNCVKGENCDFSVREFNKPIKKMYGKAAELDLQTDNTDHLFFFNFNEKGKLVFGRTLFFLQVEEPCYSLNMYKNFRSKDGFYLGLESDMDKISSRSISHRSSSRKSSMQSFGQGSPLNTKNSFNEILEILEEGDDEYSDLNLPSLSRKSSHHMTNSSFNIPKDPGTPLDYKKNCFSINTNCLQNLDKIRQV